MCGVLAITGVSCLRFIGVEVFTCLHLLHLARAGGGGLGSGLLQVLIHPALPTIPAFGFTKDPHDQYVCVCERERDRERERFFTHHAAGSVVFGFATFRILTG